MNKVLPESHTEINAHALNYALIEINPDKIRDVISKIYEGTVARIVDFGAFVNVLPNTDGLVHISQIAEERVENVSDYLKEGQIVKVFVQDVDNRGRIKLTMKGIEQGTTTTAE